MIGEMRIAGDYGHLSTLPHERKTLLGNVKAIQEAVVVITGERLRK